MNQKKITVLVIGTRHEFQRHQDRMPARVKVRAELDQRLREIIKERKIDLIAEEAGDDKAVWENLRKGEPGEELANRLFGEGSATVASPVPTIAKSIAGESGVKHEDIDVDVRADERDPESIKKRDEAMANHIFKILGNADNVLVIVGEQHRASVTERLKKEGLLVESARF
jgi:hypothetical protein